MSDFTWKTTEDRTIAILQFTNNKSIELVLKAEDVDRLLKALGDMRGTMVPPHPASLPRDGKVLALTDPAWLITNEIMAGEPLMQIRDHRYGWIAFKFTRAAAVKLGQVLITHAEKPLETSVTAIVN